MQIDWTGILLILILVLLNAFFAASEIAVISARRVKIEQLVEKGNKSAGILIRLIDDPSLFLATIQVGITLAGFLASATAAVGLSTVMAQQFKKTGIPGDFSNTLGVFFVTLIISYITLVFGELAPKRLAMQWSEKIALIAARPINVIAKATSPITRFLTFSTNLLVRLLGGNPQQQEREITEEEIRLYIAEHRTLPVEEKRMIEGVFEFGDQVVRQVMVPRTEICYIHAHEKLKDVLGKVCNAGYSAFPVYENDYDDIVGIVKIHDLACQVLSNTEQQVKDIISPALFVPETKHTVALLKEFRNKNSGMAIVVDEYGGTAGLVTLEDLVDEIIGDVVEEQKYIRKTEQGQWIIEGDTPIQEVAETLGLREINPHADYETIAGFMLEQLGHLPNEGETVSWEGYKFQVKEMGVRRIKKIQVTSNSNSP